jgi:hypothetical protein
MAPHNRSQTGLGVREGLPGDRPFAGWSLGTARLPAHGTERETEPGTLAGPARPGSLGTAGTAPAQRSRAGPRARCAARRFAETGSVSPAAARAALPRDAHLRPR